MAFDWIAFLASHRVAYSDTGPNTSRGNIVVHCPFCGPADHGQHMSINVEGRGWRCFRDNAHRGKNAARLVAALISMPLDRANALVGNATFIPDDFIGRMRASLGPPKEVPVPIGLKMPEEFKAFGGRLPSERPYARYLLQRGFTSSQVERFTDRWEMRYCPRGSFRGRIIFPIKYKKTLVSWTGRTISANEDMRYRALSRDGERTKKEGYEPALGAISHFLLWFDYLMRADADTIVLNEGPFDALKINVLGRKEGIVATCFFTSAPTREQLMMLHELLPRFKRRIVMLDSAETLATGIRITNSLSSFGVRSFALPRTLKDPGEFDQSTFGNFVLALRTGSMY